MKKTAIVILFLLFIFKANGQINVKPNYGFRLGLTAHPTFGMINAEEGKSNGINLGFAYGLLGDFNLSEHFGFSTALTVTTINGKSTEINAMPYHQMVSNPSPIAYHLKYKMQYVELPLLMKLKINEVKWFGQLGLSNGFKIKARQDAKNTDMVLAKDRNSSDWTRFYRAGLVVGAGGEFDLNEYTSVTAGLSFNKGLTNITTSKSVVRNHFVSLNLGVFF